MSDRRLEILDSAYRIVGSDGIESLHARTIAAELEINHATVHYYFRTRSDLLVGLADFALQRLEADRARLMTKVTDAVDRVEVELAIAEFYGKKKNPWVKVLVGLLTVSQADPAVRKAVTPLLKTWRSGIASSVAEAVKAKKIKATAMGRAELLADLLLGLTLSAQYTPKSVAMSENLDAVFEAMFPAK